MKIVVDRYAWIELFRGSEKGVKVKELISNSTSVFVPDIVLAEIARKYIWEGYDENTVLQRLKWIVEVATPVQIDVEVAIAASKCYMEIRNKTKCLKLSSPSLSDGIILAVARIKEAKVVTGDKHFKDFEETIWIGDY